MAIGDSYATVSDLELRLGEDDDGTFARLLDAASRAVEAFTRRQFNRDSEASARRFRALDKERVAVDDFYTLDDLTVTVNDVLWDADDVDPRPWDGQIYGIEWPYSDLFAVNRLWPWSRRALITVTANWGWAAVPAAIIEATLDVAEVMSLTLTNGQAGAVRSESIGGYAISYATPLNLSGQNNVPPELVKALPFRRQRFGVA